jgi:hypothetical protein
LFSFQSVFLRFDLSADFGDHFFEELFTFLARFGVDGMDFALAVSVVLIDFDEEIGYRLTSDSSGHVAKMKDKPCKVLYNSADPGDSKAK